MFEKEKRKGVPTRGLLYLMAGIGIGVVGMMIVTMIASRSARPNVKPTTLPVIPTPAMGVTGTADAQTVFIPQIVVNDPAVLKSFAVSESSQQVALAYWNGFNSVLQLRSWDDGHIGKTPVITLTEAEYQNLSFNPVQPALAASSGQRTSLFDLNTNTLLRTLDGGEGVYSPDGRWFALSQFNQSVNVYQDSLESMVGSLAMKGYPYDLAFSPDSQMIAAVTLDRTKAGVVYVEVFSLPDRKPIHLYTLNGVVASSVVFSPDNIHIAVVVDHSIRVLSLNDDEQRYFDVGTPIRHLTIDPSGRWLAVGGHTPGTEQNRFITIYSLEEGNALAPELVMTQSISMNSDIAGLQFVDEGLLVGEAWGAITLYRWTGEHWGDPIMAMDSLE